MEAVAEAGEEKPTGEGGREEYNEHERRRRRRRDSPREWEELFPFMNASLCNVFRSCLGD